MDLLKGIDDKAFEFLKDKLQKLLNKIPDEYLITEIHKITDQILINNNFKEEIQCNKQDCSFCCHDEIFITPLEAAHLKKTKVVPNTSLQNIQKSSDFRKLPFAEKACIFLKEGKCSVYSNRPMVCRLHNITKGQNPVDCIVDEKGHTNKSMHQVFTVETQALMYYIVLREKMNLNSIYKYEF